MTRILLATVATVLLTACGGSIGVEEEEQLGDAYAGEIAQQVSLIDDPAAEAALAALASQIVAQADSTGRRYDFHLVDSDDANAFAIPGGHVYVNRGLIARADELSELMGVLGHEIAHVTERHGLEQAEKAQRTNLLVSLFYLITGRDPGMLDQILIQGGGAAVFAKYGRDAEREADARAVGWLVAAGYHPEGMATFFEELLREQQHSPGAVEQWFSTHPTSEERIDNTRALIAGLGDLEQSGLVRDTPEYQRFRERVAGGW